MDQATFDKICNSYTVLKNDLSLIIQVLAEQAESDLTMKETFFLRAYRGSPDSTSICHYTEKGQHFSWTGSLAGSQTTVDMFVFTAPL